jgi:hypothetical protein
MLADEADPAPREPARHFAGNFALTIGAADLICRGDDDLDSQGNYDYQAHAHVLPGGADPLESCGYASVGSSPDQLEEAAREAKSSRAFLFLAAIIREGSNWI